jgi:Flp pilus assembly protein TadD
MRRLLIATSIFLLAGPALAVPPPASGLDGLFARLAKAQTSEDAKPVEKEILARFLQSNSATVDLLMTRANALIEANDADTAARILDAVTRLAPTYAEGWHQKGKLEADAGKDEAAMVSLQKAVNLNPREFEAHVDLGEMLVQYGAKPAGLAEFKKALALDPKYDGLDRRVEQLARDVEGEKI